MAKPTRPARGARKDPKQSSQDQAVPDKAQLDEARRRADAADADDIDDERGAVEGKPGQRAGEKFDEGSGYGELHGEGDWGWRGVKDHRYGEYPEDEPSGDSGAEGPEGRGAYGGSRFDLRHSATRPRRRTAGRRPRRRGF